MNSPLLAVQKRLPHTVPCIMISLMLILLVVPDLVFTATFAFTFAAYNNGNLSFLNPCSMTSLKHSWAHSLSKHFSASYIPMSMSFKLLLAALFQTALMTNKLSLIFLPCRAPTLLSVKCSSMPGYSSL